MDSLGVKFTTFGAAADEMDFVIEGIKRVDIGASRTLKDISQHDDNAINAFDFHSLEIEFAKLCKDYPSNIENNDSSIALQFGLAMLFKVSPEARRVKKSGNDKTWPFIMMFGSDNKPATGTNPATSIGTVFVHTFNKCPPPVKQPVYHNNQIELTIEQACLLATTIVSKMVYISLTKRSILMTPLARAIFTEDDVDKICHDCDLPLTVENRSVIIIRIIQSCQSGGHSLLHSRAAIGVCASLVSTRHMKDRGVANRIVQKIFKQYRNAGKQFDMSEFKIYYKNATGGIPAGHSPEILMQRLTDIQKLRREQLIEIEENNLRSQSELDLRTGASQPGSSSTDAISVDTVVNPASTGRQRDGASFGAETGAVPKGTVTKVIQKKVEMMSKQSDTEESGGEREKDTAVESGLDTRPSSIE